jgi:hypothetical protein
MKNKTRDQLSKLIRELSADLCRGVVKYDSCFIKEMIRLQNEHL